MWPRKSTSNLPCKLYFHSHCLYEYRRIEERDTMAGFELWNKVYLWWNIIFLKFLGEYTMLNFFWTSSASSAVAWRCLVVVSVTKGKCLFSCQRATWALSRDKEMVKEGGKGVGRWIFCRCHSITIYVIKPAGVCWMFHRGKDVSSLSALLLETLSKSP